MTSLNILTPTYLALFATTLLLSACSGGGSSDGESSSLPSNLPINANEEIPVNPEQTGMFDNLNSTPIGGDFPNDGVNADLTGVLIPTILATETSIDLAYAQAGAALIEQVNGSLLIPVDINVVFADCGAANAFFVPSPVSIDPSIEVTPGTVVMCHELTELFSQFFNTPEEGFQASSFVLMHELGHALVKVLDLPVVGLEEVFVDAVSAVFLGESGLGEGTLLAGIFFGAQGATPFFDTHRAGPQRLGDLGCWGIGADPSLLDDPITAMLAAGLMAGGRDCPMEYAELVSSLDEVLGDNIVGGLNLIDGQ